MSDYLKEVLASGRKVLTDTKTPKKHPEPSGKPGKLPNPAAGSPPEKDPHKVFVRRMTKERPKKKDLVEEVQKFCDEADSQL
jgi:hypothetical protein